MTTQKETATFKQITNIQWYTFKSWEEQTQKFSGVHPEPGRNRHKYLVVYSQKQGGMDTNIQWCTPRPREEKIQIFSGVRPEPERDTHKYQWCMPRSREVQTQIFSDVYTQKQGGIDTKYLMACAQKQGGIDNILSIALRFGLVLQHYVQYRFFFFFLN